MGWLGPVASRLFSGIAIGAGAADDVLLLLLPLIMLAPPWPALEGVGCGEAVAFEMLLAVRALVADFGMVILRPAEGAVVFAGVGEGAG